MREAGRMRVEGASPGRAMLVGVLDDRAVSIDAYAALLKRIPSVTVKTFVSPHAALEWVPGNHPDLMILDFRKPSPDGIDFIAKFRETKEHTPIIIVTAEADRDIRRRALESGANDYLTKPADPVEFLTRVRNHLGMQQLRKDLEKKAETLARDVVVATQEIADREHETITRLVRAAEFRDGDTGKHIVRMGHYAALLGKVLGSDADEQRLLLLATPMHDVGKVATPDAILLKKGSLTDEQWEIMRLHTRAGHAILSGSQSRVLQLAATIALRHHERWDGTGYPDKIRGTDIPLAARITAVGDVFDALCSERPYKHAWTREDAFKELLLRKNTHFDPMLVDAFLDSRDEVEEIADRFADK